jgi:hypothetical protein
LCGAAFDRIGSPCVRTWQIPYLALQERGRGTEPAGRRYYTSSCYLGDLPDPVVDLLVSAAADCPSPISVIDLGYLLGAIARVPDADTAFPRRAAPYICSASAAWDDPADDDANVAWSRSLTRGLRDWQFGGSYVNYTSLDGGSSARSIYDPAHYERLAALKSLVDPDNVFRVNHNIAPAAGAVPAAVSGRSHRSRAAPDR